MCGRGHRLALILPIIEGDGKNWTRGAGAREAAEAPRVMVAPESSFGRTGLLRATGPFRSAYFDTETGTPVSW